MHSIEHHLASELHWYQVVPAFAVVVIVAIIVLAIVMRLWRKSASTLVLQGGAGLAKRTMSPKTDNYTNHSAPTQSPNSLVDTVFVVPDISGYTRFIALSKFAFDHGQHIVFELLNSIIQAAQGHLQLSKLEGDAVLFFQTSKDISAGQLGSVIWNIYRAFYVRRNNLIKSNLCLCQACRNISSLHLKVFVHEGQASYFRFRDGSDVYGSDAIIVHRLMKNTIPLAKYLLVTEPASSRLELPFGAAPNRMIEDIEHVGQMPVLIYEIDDTLISNLIADDVAQSGDRWREFIGKFRFGLNSGPVKHPL